MRGQETEVHSSVTVCNCSVFTKCKPGLISLNSFLYHLSCLRCQSNTCIQIHALMVDGNVAGMLHCLIHLDCFNHGFQWLCR